MEATLRRRFANRWRQYFPGAELPITFYYTETPDRVDATPPQEAARCIICDLAPVRAGASRCFDVDTVRCGGGRRYLGFEQETQPNFPYFLSSGIPGEMEGERYKKSPELVEAYLESQPAFEAPGQFLIFKRWDHLDEEDDPAVVIFFAQPDVLSGLFTLVNFDEIDPQSVIAPFGSGCSSIVYHPYHQLDADRPRAVLGMFDVSARPCVPADTLTLAVPWPKFARMVDYMDESFLIARDWQKVRARIA
jgi:hypothetical protein